LASNSLLEAAVMAHRAAERVPEELARGKPPAVPPWYSGDARDSDELVVVLHNWEEIRHMMWNYVGIARSTRRLERAKRRINVLLEEIAEYYWDFRVTSDLIELRDIAVVADLIITSAWRRKESRGLHFNIDYPEPDPLFAVDTVIERPRPGKRSLPLAGL
ncbi:MAG: L-aspartate oxidase, partial [Myxococcales bacterium]|nr:L-aspartate oxidase [Myxococcales bacterium]